MDFFDDSNLFEGGLEGLGEDGFPPGPSLVDELNLSADFEPLQVETLGPVKHQDMMPGVSAQQHLPNYSQQMGHYGGIKQQNPMAQAFSGSQSTGCDIMAEQLGQFHNTAIGQVPQSNGLFCNSGSPMWGNQDQNGNMFHPLSQQQRQQLCHQQLHNQQLHVRQHPQQQNLSCRHQQEEQQHRMRQQQLQQQSHHQHLLNQHRQINTSVVSLQQQHHNFSFHQGGQSNNQQQVQHSEQPIQHQITQREAQFYSRVHPNKSYLENASLSRTSLPIQQQDSYHALRRGQAFPGSGLEDSILSHPTHSSSRVQSLSTCSVTSANAYQPAPYPAYPGESEIPNFGQLSSSTATVSGPTATSSLTSTVPGLSGAACQFQSPALMRQLHTKTTVNQADECSFQVLGCSVESQKNFKSSEMFGETMKCYPNVGRPLPSEQPQCCGAINTNGYQALGDGLLASEAQDSKLESLETTDLLPDLLPQLEDTFKAESWIEASQKGCDDSNPTSREYKAENVSFLTLLLFLSALVAGHNWTWKYIFSILPYTPLFTPMFYFLIFRLC